MTHKPTETERRVHVVVIVAAAVLAVAMVAAAAWSLTRPEPVRELPQAALTPGQESTASVATSAGVSGVTTATSTTTTSTSTAQASADTTRGTIIIAGHRIAYRVAAALYVADEDGTHPHPAYGTSSNYALSPDGLKVASIESGKFAVVPVGARPTSKADLEPGTAAEGVTPVWTEDSSAAMFVRADASGVPSVWRYTISDKVLVEVGAGSGMAVSPDGRTVVALPTESTDSGQLTVWTPDGKDHTIALPSGDPVAIALSASRIYVSTMSSGGDASLWSMTLAGKDRKRLVGAASAGTTQATYGQIILSPDGRHLLYTVEGDDGYSRIRLIPIGGGASVAISGLRDGYPLGWSSDGKYILFVEGNAYQGQTTALWRCDLTGHNRKQLVKHATM